MTRVPKTTVAAWLARLKAATMGWRTANPPLMDIALCTVSEGELRGVAAHRRGGNVKLRGLATNGNGKFEKSSRARHVAVLLPQSEYLVKNSEIPAVLPHEVRSLLQLELEARLPQEMGEIELSFRQLPTARKGHLRYETYIARRSVINTCLLNADNAAVGPAAIIPSAVAWDALLQAHPDVAMFVSDFGDTGLEAALRQADQSLSIRTIQADVRDPEARATAVTEALRYLRAQSKEDPAPLVVGWLLAELPPPVENDGFVFRNLDELWGGPPDGRISAVDALLPLAARSLCQTLTRQSLADADLRPVAGLARMQARQVQRRLYVGAAMLIVALVLAAAALKIQVIRYQAYLNQLTSQIQRIKTDGELTERRAEQLRVVRAALASRGNFTGVLDALYTATPKGVSYNQVELQESGNLRLRGQAESLALPFLLPEQLDAQAIFQQALLGDASQGKKAGGSLTEFRVECQLERAQQ